MERDTPDFSMYPKPRVAPATRPRQASESQPSSSSVFFLLKSQPTLPVRDVIHIQLSGISIWGICEWHILPACAWTPAPMFAPN